MSKTALTTTRLLEATYSDVSWKRVHGKKHNPNVIHKKSSPEEAQNLLSELERTRDSSVITAVLKRISKLAKEVVSPEIIIKVKALKEHPSFAIKNAAGNTLLAFSQKKVLLASAPEELETV